MPKQIVAVEDWGWWFKVGETYTVRPFEYKATRGATIDYCFCLECQEERAGKEMFDMYECLDDAHRGSIIPVVACRDAVRVTERQADSAAD